MTTATWPVPYYNRVQKAYPIRGNLNRPEERRIFADRHHNVRVLRPTRHCIPEQYTEGSEIDQTRPRESEDE